MFQPTDMIRHASKALVPHLSVIAAMALAWAGRADWSITLAWDANPEPDVVSYRVYQGTASRSYSVTNEVIGATQCVVSNLPIETPYFFAVTAVNLAGLESDFSEELRYCAIEEGIEGDVAPRPEGSRNGTVTVSDWVQVGRFAAGLDALAAVSEFRRADCAPRFNQGNLSAGNGFITVSDWVQAGRYAAGLDNVTPVAGPTVSAQGLLSHRSNGPSVYRQSTAIGRSLKIEPVAAPADGPRAMIVYLHALGDENALGFSLAFDSRKLRFRTIEAGASLTTGTLLINDAQASQGRVGLAIALAAQQSFAPGDHRVATLYFDSAADGASESAEFSDSPVAVEVADAAAEPLAVRLINLPALETPQWPPTGSMLRIAGSAGEVVLSWPSALHGARIEFSSDLGSGIWQPLDLTPAAAAAEWTARVAIQNDRMRFFRLTTPSQPLKE